MFFRNLVRLLPKLSFINHLFAPLYIIFLVLVVLILGQQGLNLWLQHFNHEVAVEVTHTLVVERKGEQLLNSLIDEKEALIKDYSQSQFSRGLENESNFLFCNSFNNLYNLVQDNPDQLKQLNSIKNLYNNWRSELNYKAPYDGVSISSTYVTFDTLFSSLRSEIGILIEREEMLLDKRRNNFYQLSDINTAINIFSTVTILVAVGLNVQFLHRRLQVPLHELTEIAKLWRQGKMSVKFSYSYDDEIGQLARVLNGIADETQNRQKSVEVQNQQLEDMICALSHDLRAPLLAARSSTLR